MRRNIEISKTRFFYEQLVYRFKAWLYRNGLRAIEKTYVFEMNENFYLAECHCLLGAYVDLSNAFLLDQLYEVDKPKTGKTYKVIEPFKKYEQKSEFDFTEEDYNEILNSLDND